MDIVETDGWRGPIPAAEGEYGEFFRACAQGELRIQECVACGHRQASPRALCARCGADVRWIDCSGSGTVHTLTVVRQIRVEPFGEETPYVVAVVDLAEGARLLGTVIDCEPDEVRIGVPVVAVARKIAPDIAIPVWRLVS